MTLRRPVSWLATNSVRPSGDRAKLRGQRFGLHAVDQRELAAVCIDAQGAQGGSAGWMGATLAQGQPVYAAIQLVDDEQPAAIGVKGQVPGALWARHKWRINGCPDKGKGPVAQQLISTQAADPDVPAIGGGQMAWACLGGVEHLQGRANQAKGIQAVVPRAEGHGHDGAAQGEPLYGAPFARGR